MNMVKMMVKMTKLDSSCIENSNMNCEYIIIYIVFSLETGIWTESIKSPIKSQQYLEWDSSELSSEQ